MCLSSVVFRLSSLVAYDLFVGLNDGAKEAKKTLQKHVSIAAA